MTMKKAILLQNQINWKNYSFISKMYYLSKRKKSFWKENESFEMIKLKIFYGFKRPKYLNVWKDLKCNYCLFRLGEFF